MTIDEKKNKIQNLFNQQKEILSNITSNNYFDSILNIRKLEVQKEIIIRIPIPKYKEGAYDNKPDVVFFNQCDRSEIIVDKNLGFLNHLDVELASRNLRKAFSLTSINMKELSEIILKIQKQ